MNIKKNKYLAYLIGVYLSDGTIFKRNRGYVFQLCSIDPDYVEHTQRCVENLIGKIGHIKKEEPHGYGKKDIYRLYFFSKGLFEEIEKTTNNKKAIPDWIKNDPKYIKECFAGLIDGDGWVCYNVCGSYRGLTWQIGLSGTEELLKIVAKLWHSMGLKCWGPTKIKTSKETYRLYFDVIDFIACGINLKIKRKQDKIKFIKKILRDYTLVAKNEKRISKALGNDIVRTT